MKPFSLGLGLMLFCGACVTTTGPVPRRPSWMDNPQVKYPVRYYLTAMGEGDTLQDAQSVATGNLAKIFRSDVHVDERLRERYVELMGRQNSYQEQSQFDRDVSIGSALSVVNVQYADSYKDETGRFYALALMNRAATAEIYATRLNENNERTCYFVGQSDGQSPAMTYAALSAALAVSAESQILLGQLDVISPSTKKAIQMTHAHDALARQAAEAAGQVLFDVRISNDREGKIAASVESLMTGLGFGVAADAQALRVLGSVSFEETDLKRDALAFIRYEVKLDVLDTAGHAVVSVAERGREGHVSKLEAEARCVGSVVALIDRELRPRLLAYFDSLVVPAGAPR